MTKVFDHVAGKKGSKLGFKNLTLGLFDGKSFLPVDLTLQVEKPLKNARHRKERFKKQRDPKSAGAKRIRECNISKITNGINMLKRALKQGFRAKYVLVDSWFASYEFIQTVRDLNKKSMHLKLGTCQSRDFDTQIAHITTCYLLYTLLAYFRRVNDYESLDGLFSEIKERLWELFDELLQVVITSVAKSGLVNIMEFANSVEYQFLKELFENSFLTNQMKALENAC